MTDPHPKLPAAAYARLERRLAPLDAELARRYPGGTGIRQPIHTVYVPANRFHRNLAREWRDSSLAALATDAPDAPALQKILDLPAGLMAEVYPRVVAKLEREPIEDLRIDFEDGFGPRADSEEDAIAAHAGAELAHAISAGTAPPFVGIRFKSLDASTRRRGIRTVDVFLAALQDRVPANFVLTLPKVTDVEQVVAFAEVCLALEASHGLASGQLQFEIQIETPQAVLASDGTAAVARMVHSAAGRLRGLHYGTYDYSAALGVSAAFQSLEHPAADHAKAVMQLAAAATGVQVSDGSTNIVPVGDHAAVASTWQLHARLIQRSLERAFYQGWDLHPAQLVTRYTATYAFFRSGMPAAANRLRAYLEKSNSGTLDEPATAQAIASLLVRGLECGAIDDDEVAARTGVERATLDALYRRRVA